MWPALLTSRLARRLVAAAVAALSLLLALVGVAVLTAASILTALTGSPAHADSDLSGADCPPNPAQGTDTKTHLKPDQAHNAKVIISTGQQMSIPTRGHVVAIATALQESGLKNLHGGDRDSQGLFQQRPSAGWGSPAQITQPAYAARQFYAHLKHVSGWEQMSITRAAQAVQKSAFPDTYAQHENRAVAIVTQLSKSAGKGADVSGCTPDSGAPTKIAAKMLATAGKQKGKPYVWGATGPSSFDCSGLIVYGYRTAGYQLTVRTSQEMHRVATPIKNGKEKPGDLLFSHFGKQDGAPGPAHVLIVVRPGTAVEAPRTGVPVRERHYDTTKEHMKIGRIPNSALKAID